MCPAKVKCRQIVRIGHPLINSAVKSFEFFFNEFSSKKFQKFFTVNFIEKKIRHFIGKFEKKHLPQKKRGAGGGIPTIFPRKSDMTFRRVLMRIPAI